MMMSRTRKMMMLIFMILMKSGDTTIWSKLVLKSLLQYNQKFTLAEALSINGLAIKVYMAVWCSQWLDTVFAILFFFLWFWLSGVRVIWDNCWHVVLPTSQVESFGQFCLRIVFLVFVAWYHCLIFDPRSWWGIGSKYFGEESLWADVSSTSVAPPWPAWTGHWLIGH